jgi:hypothetical protein
MTKEEFEELQLDLQQSGMSIKEKDIAEVQRIIGIKT